MNEKSYKKLLKKFIEKGYKFKKFSDFNINKQSQVILRHDVDFDIDLALKMAQIENKVDIKSTYYFLVSSDSYNIFSKQNKRKINKINEMSHEVSIHFDPKVYENELEGFKFEKKIFESEFFKIKSISFHRPSQNILNGVNWLPKQIINSYDKKFFNEISYFSDSGGNFRYGDPTDSFDFKIKKNIQLLIHPIWWMLDNKNTIKKIKNFLNINKQKMSIHFSKNCKNWKKYLNER